MQQLFFELIRVAIGTQNTLSRPPSKGEWAELYAMAKKQSLVGICFAGLRRLYNSVNQEPSTRNPQPNSTQNQALELCSLRYAGAEEPITQNLDEVLYLQWMGMAAKIQQRNEVVNRQCVELQAKLSGDGLDSAILKGQGVATAYPEHLRGLRQSGDIDVWVQNKSIPELVGYMKGLGVGYKATAAHVECEMFPDTDVELHAEPAFFRSFRNDRKLKRWFQEFNVSSFDSAQEPIGFSVPSIEFNLVYMMVHMYHHVLFEGLGLRQLMDYYFVLFAANKTKTIKTPEGSASARASENSNEFDSSASQSSADSSAVGLEPSGKKQQKQLSIPSMLAVLDSLGMKRFATGIMWIMKEVFALEDKYLICEANEKYGRLILKDVMAGGNFGHHDEKNKGLHGGTAIGRSLNGLRRNLKFFALGPWEILSSPVWSTWHWWWRKRHGLIC